jgi:hypothetical protein
VTVFLDTGDVPWWAFLMMPIMMIGMGLMMWFMMRMMMGMDHGSSHGSPQTTAEQSNRVADSEVDSLRRQVAELQERLAAIETGTEGREGEESPRTQPGASRSNEGEEP